MQIEQALMTYLLAQTDIHSLVGEKIFFMRAPEGTEDPYIVVQKIDRPSYHSQDGADNVASPRFQFSIFASDYGTLKPVTMALKAALDGYKGTMTTGAPVVQMASWENETDLDPGDSGLYGIACDYIITHGAES